MGFAPLENPAAKVLLLGSMPSRASLAAGEYYAHPRNLFWPLLGELLGFDPRASYRARRQAVAAAGVAVWDVIGACRRPGSLDASIDPASVAVNDFATFFARHPLLTHVFFNGAAAEAAFRRYVLPGLDARNLHFERLPSTSPANAAVSIMRKRAAWRAILGALATAGDGVGAHGDKPARRRVGSSGSRESPGSPSRPRTGRRSGL